MIAGDAFSQELVVSGRRTAANTLISGIQCTHCDARLLVFGIGFDEYQARKMMSVEHSEKCRYFCKSEFRLSGAITRAGKAGNMAVTTDASKQVGYVGSVPILRAGHPISSIQRAPAPDSPINLNEAPAACINPVGHPPQAEGDETTFPCNTSQGPRPKVSPLSASFLEGMVIAEVDAKEKGEQ